MELDAGSLEKGIEEAFPKVVQQESRDLAITNPIESWLDQQEDVVRRPESIGSRSETASHVSCAHHCSCRKQIAQLQSENQAMKINQETRFSSLTMRRNYAHPPYPSRIRWPDLHVPPPMQQLKKRKKPGQN